MKEPGIAPPAVAGLHHLRLPVSDIMRSRDWYSAMFGFDPRLTLEEEDRVVGVVLIHGSGLTLGLHHAPGLARALHDFCSVALSVGDVDDLDHWCTHVDTLGRLCVQALRLAHPEARTFGSGELILGRRH